MTTNSIRRDVLQEPPAAAPKAVPPLMSAQQMRHGKLPQRKPVSMAPPAVPTVYRHGGRIFAEFSAVFWWFLFWMFNGGCTALSFAAAAQWLAGKFYTALPVWVSFRFMVPAGIIVHLMISTMEQHLWQSGQASGTAGERIAALSKLRIAEAVIVGSIDSVTTSRTLVLIVLALGGNPSMRLNAICALIGTAMALVPEPMLRYHGGSLKSLAGR